MGVQVEDQLQRPLSFLELSLKATEDDLSSRGPETTSPEMEFKEFEPRVKSAKTRFELSAGLNLETFDTILSGTNHI